MHSCKDIITTGDGQAIYCPRYVAILRRVEADIVTRLQEIGAHEIMLPKLISPRTVDILSSCSPYLSDDWSREQYKVISPDGNLAGYLAHWQCEPYYGHIAELSTILGDPRPLILFDRSGPSHRCESVSEPFRKREFWRVEIMMSGRKDDIIDIRNAIIEFLSTYITSCTSAPIARVDKNENPGEEVVDLIATYADQSIEVFGSHVHNAEFSPLTKTFLRNDEITACAGVSLTRLATLIAIKSPQPIRIESTRKL